MLGPCLSRSTFSSRGGEPPHSHHLSRPWLRSAKKPHSPNEHALHLATTIELSGGRRESSIKFHTWNPSARKKRSEDVDTRVDAGESRPTRDLRCGEHSWADTAGRGSRPIFIAGNHSSTALVGCLRT